MAQALDYLLKGETFLGYFTKAANAEAQRMFKAAIGVDSKFARAHAYLSYALLQAYLYNWYDGSPDDAISEMTSYAEAAVQTDGGDYQNLWIRASVHLYSKEFDEASKGYDAAYQLAAMQAIPEDMRAFQVDRADMMLLTGNSSQSIKDVQKALKCAVPERWFYWVLAWAYYVDQQYDASLQALGNFHNPRNAIRKNVIANLVALNRMKEASDQAMQFLQEEKDQGILYAKPGALVYPTLDQVENRIPFSDSAVLQRWKGHLKAAFDGLTQN